MQGQYNIANHTILPLIYKILGPNNHISYLLKNPPTKSLLMFNPLSNISINKNYTLQTENKYHSWLIQHIENIQKISQSKLSHIVCNHGLLRNQYTKFIDKLQNKQNRKDIKIMMPSGTKNNNIKPQVSGEISVCFIQAQGYTSDYNLIGVTHISPTSTKVPVLFVNNLLGVCRIDYQYQINGSSDKQYINSLNKVKYFPNQTYIFPSQVVQQADILFAKAVINTEAATTKAKMLIQQKVKLFENNHMTNPDCLIPTTVYEEKLLNPFLNPQKYSKLLGVKEQQKSKCFGLLRTMRSQWKM